MSMIVRIRALNPGALLAPLRARLRLAAAIHRERAALARLDARLLRDIGVDPIDAAREAARPPWDAPAERVTCR